MKIKLHEEAAQALKDWLGDDPAQPITLHIGEGHMGEGLYVSLNDYPSEGAEFLCGLNDRGHNVKSQPLSRAVMGAIKEEIERLTPRQLIDACKKCGATNTSHHYLGCQDGQCPKMNVGA